MISLIWEGADGSVWDLHTGPVRLTAEGTQGLGSALFDVKTSDRAVGGGVTFNGYRVRDRSVVLPLYLIPTATETDFWGVWNAFWASLRVEAAGRLIVTTPQGQRWVTARFGGDGNRVFKTDPTIDRRTPITVILDVDAGVWFSDEITHTVPQAVSPPWGFFGPDGRAPSFWLYGPTSAEGRFRIENPGDEPVWLRWVVQGPASGEIALGIDGSFLRGSVVLVEGESLTVDTAPHTRTFFLRRASGVVEDAAELFSTQEFAPVMPGGSIVQAKVQGSPTITASFNPAFRRGF